MIDKYGDEVLRDTSRHISKYGLLGHFAVLTSVSYTHLDVYKRQVFKRRTGNRNAVMRKREVIELR